MVRCFVALGLLALASAVGVSQTNQLHQVASRSEFGQSVLAELQSKLDTGSPLEELESIIGDIRKRLDEAQQADDAQNELHQQQCADWLAELDRRIAAEEANIKRLEGEIEQTKSDIESKEIEIDDSKQRIVTHKANIAGWEQDKIDATNQRAIDKEVFENRTRDTIVCIDAIDEIGKVEGWDKLSANQDNKDTTYDADFYNDDATSTAYKTPASFLEATAARVSDPQAKDLILLAAVASATMDKGDVDDLQSLLAKLDKELKQYKKQLAADEEQSIKDYEAEIARLNKLIKDEQEALAAEEANLAKLEGELRALENKLRELEAELETSKAKLAELQETRRLDQLKCDGLKEAYDQRTADRKEENDTLDEITEILREKLAPALAKDGQEIDDNGDLQTVESHVGAAVNDVTVA